MPVIEVVSLSKTYGDVLAVDELSFEVREGEVYALLGENGAGKSTTVEILEGYRSTTAGEVRVLGIDPARADRAFHDRVGIVLQTSGVEDEFTVREVVDLYGGCYSARRGVDELVSLVGLEDKVDDRIGSLSGGQRRRVDLALGIVGYPDVLFLDEPTTGFDPAARRKSWGLVESLGRDGATILLTTHYLDEAEHLADRVGVLAHGRLVAEGTPEELINQVSGTIVSFMLPASISPSDAVATLGPLFGAEVRVAGRLAEATIDQPTAAVHRLTGWAIEAGVELESLSVQRASLEDVYLALVGEHPAEPTAMSEFPGNISLLAQQTRYQLVSFRRIPIAFFFTIALPVIMLVLFNALFGDDRIDTPQGSWPLRQFYTGGLAAYTAVSASYTNLANMVPIRRDEGVLKRWKGTPLPTWTYIAGFVASAVVIALVGVVLMLTLGVVFYDLQIEWAKMPAAAVTFLVGVSTFAALGLALASVVKSASSASAAANATILPLAFVSDVFVALSGTGWIVRIGDFFPLKPFVNAFQDCFNPLVDAPAFDWTKLAQVAAWGAVGAFVAVRNFTWEPSGSAPRGRRSRRARTAVG